MASILKIKDQNGDIIDIPAIRGKDGASAYDIAVKHGYEGSEEEWLEGLGGGGVTVTERPTESIIFSDSEIIGYPCYEYYLPLLAWKEILPVGTEIKTIKIKYNGAWVDIHELNTLDCIPYVLTMNKVYVDELDSKGYVFALIGRVGVWGVVAEAFSVDNITEVEVIYYTDGGVE